jgi:hypothetical protein
MNELLIIEVLERTASALSLIGFIIIAFTYWAFPTFHSKYFNKLVFYASWGNMGSNVATLISVSGLRAANANPESGLCRAQGFLIQW